MNKNKRIKMVAVAAAVAIAGTVTVYAAYDSSKDPIVSLSYLGEVFKPAVKSELKSEIKSELKSEIKSELSDELKSSVSSASDAIENELKNEFNDLYSSTFEALQKQIDILANEYETVTLQKGKRLTVGAACEMVILSGNATVRCSTPSSGIIDCTDGVILYDGQNIPTNHKLLVPENGDGRGITASGTVQLLIKGGYTVG